MDYEKIISSSVIGNLMLENEWLRKFTEQLLPHMEAWYTMNVQVTTVKRSVVLINPHAETTENPSNDDLNKEFGSSSVQEVSSTDVAGQDVSPSAKDIGSQWQGYHLFQKDHYKAFQENQASSQETSSLKRDQMWCI
ncbi:hypothetical protein TNCV_151811 [Trichonephila clavipes]|uniref:Uncharacterized protein n=1 Tax=Trichonephila clavipes TaxID=2585209 RepID=A0A8X6RN10_TRICX|nr:hypothetical protein TNCV_151811 [Trichonephila clavipes]